jgi:Ca-activated chloride channel homolog
MGRCALPLRALSYRARVLDRFAEVTVEQTFENNLHQPLEAIYTFPLSADSCVTALEVRFADRVLKGVVARRDDARREFEESVARGQQAALVEQDREEIFTVSLGSLRPSESATVKLVYSELLPAFEGGETELRLPLVVAPRYSPALSRERAPDPPRLAEGLRAGIALSIDVEVWEESEPTELSCTQHAVRTRSDSGKLMVQLAREDELLDRDFVLRWRTNGARERTLLCVTRQGGHAYGVLALAPPVASERRGRPRDVVFLLDRSGSMEGDKLSAARKAVAKMLQSLRPDDNVTIATFSDRIDWFTGAAGALLVQASSRALSAAEKWLSSVAANGGTELGPALEAALSALAGGSTRLPLLVLVTDGQVGNEGEILKRAEPRLGSTRVFTLGIDSAVNAPFLRRLARLGRGTATLCEPGALGASLERMSRELSAPAALDLQLDDRELGLEPDALVPQRLPDLWAGRHEAVFFRCRNTSGSLVVRGSRADGEPFETLVRAEDVAFSSIAKLWARARIRDLEDREHLAPLENRRAEISALALEHQILSRFTSFLVVDRERVATDVVVPALTVVQPVEKPASWGPRRCDVSCRRSPFAPQGPFVSKDDPGFRPGRIIKKKHVVEARMHERDRWKRASTARRRTPGPNLEHAPPHAKWLRSAMKELSAVLAVVLAALEADRWPDNAGAGLSRRREVALDRLQAAESSKPLGPAGQRLHRQARTSTRCVRQRRLSRSARVTSNHSSPTGIANLLPDLPDRRKLTPREMIFYDARDQSIADRRGDRRLYWLDDLGAAPVGEARPDDEGFLFAGARPIEDYRKLVARLPRLRDRPEEREPLLRLDTVLDTLERAQVKAPMPRTWQLEVDARLPSDLSYPLFLRTPLSSWKLGGRISRVRNERELAEEAEQLRRAFGWNVKILAREWLDLETAGESAHGPVPQEVRVWVVDGTPVAWSFHHLHVVPKATGFPPSETDLAGLKRLAASIAAPFRSRLVVADFARRVDGQWSFLEAGPGSCAGTAHEAVFKHIASRLLGSPRELRADSVGGSLS